MKFAVIISVAILLIGLVVAQKDPICLEEPLVEGLCPDAFSGLTYSKGSGCVPYRANGCNIHGNFFRTREDCHAKCHASINALFEDFYLRSVDQFGVIIFDVISSIRNLFGLEN